MDNCNHDVFFYGVDEVVHLLAKELKFPKFLVLLFAVDLAKFSWVKFFPYQGQTVSDSFQFQQEEEYLIVFVNTLVTDHLVERVLSYVIELHKLMDVLDCEEEARIVFHLIWATRRHKTEMIEIRTVLIE